MSENGSVSGYDAAQDSSVRSALLFPCNSRIELRGLTRKKLLQKHRGLEANLAILGRIKAKYRRYAVGKGIMPQPVTRDEEWNSLAKAIHERWASNPGVYSIDASRDLFEDQGLVAEAMIGDGEFFEALVNSETGAPMVQPLDPFEIETPPNAQRLFEDGVRTNRFLRPISYAVRELRGPFDPPQVGLQGFREISAADMIHIFRRRRAKQVRGFIPTYAAQNPGTDAIDTLGLEIATDKLHSALGVAVTRKQATDGKPRGVTGNIEKTFGPDGALTKVEEKFWQGAGILELKEGEDLKLLTSDRPGRARLEGIVFLFRLISLACDLPLSVIFSFAELGGVPTRAELEDAQNAFEMLQDMIVWRHSQRLWVWRIARAMKSGELRACRDPYWWACDWHGPAKITVDLGRTADANIALSRNLMMSHERFWEERGGNAYDEARKEIRFRKWLKDECEREGLKVEELIEPTPGAVTNLKVQPSEE